jgi:hypothetical protein
MFLHNAGRRYSLLPPAAPCNDSGKVLVPAARTRRALAAYLLEADIAAPWAKVS